MNLRKNEGRISNEVLTEPLIARHYRAHVQVETLGDAPVVLPARLESLA
jgi:hypothetical protein